MVATPSVHGRSRLIFTTAGGLPIRHSLLSYRKCRFSRCIRLPDFLCRNIKWWKYRSLPHREWSRNFGLGSDQSHCRQAATAGAHAFCCCWPLRFVHGRCSATESACGIASPPALPHGQPTVGRMEPVDGSRFHRGLQKTAIRAEALGSGAPTEPRVLSKSLLAAVPLAEAANLILAGRTSRTGGSPKGGR